MLSHNQPTLMVPNQVALKVSRCHQLGQVVVLVTGVFDLLHQEHRTFLEKAKQAGDFLLVGVESDVRVRQIKGPDRPIQTQSLRLDAIQQLSCVDAAFVLPEEFNRPEHYRQLIDEVRPEILAVSSHSPHLDKKRAVLAEFGGKVEVVHQHNPAVSTTQLLSQKRFA